MNIFIGELKKHLVKYYNIRANEVESIVEDEWEYLDDEYLNSTPVDEVAKNLIAFYMVA